MKEETKIKGFKGMNKDMKCRDHQYEVGKEYETTETPVRCTSNGFHFCENPFDVFGYYPAGESRFFEVEGSGEVSTDTQDSKVAVSKIKIGIELSLQSLIESGIKLIFSKTTITQETTNTRDKFQATNQQKNKQASNSGYRGAASNSGYRGAASNSGYRGAASNSGDRGAASNSGYRGAASNSGDRGAASNSGYRGAASNSGDRGAASNSGDIGAASNSGYIGAASNSGYRGAASNSGDIGAASNSGYIGAAFTIGHYSSAETNAKESVAVGVGYQNKAKGNIGAWLVLAERNDKLEIVSIQSVKVDGKEIKENIFHKLENGKFTEA